MTRNAEQLLRDIDKAERLSVAKDLATDALRSLVDARKRKAKKWKRTRRITR